MIENSVVKPLYGISTFPLTAKAVYNQKDTHLKICKIILLIKAEDQQPSKAEKPSKLLHKHVR